MTEDVALALGALRRAFPGVLIWHGKHTRRWWAMAGGRLIEASDPRELAGRLSGQRL
ncbi:hypothetical protein [Actinomadura gamaensis]|uniref:Uncharacterized protein n=1 Tax=Actinomadura gamaensis TaxID=1763541 RepID=A0ABV9UDP4_9ACTN